MEESTSVSVFLKPEDGKVKCPLLSDNDPPFFLLMLMLTFDKGLLLFLSKTFP